MANEEKLAKFHQAINHYAQEQRRKIEEEVADFKKRELEEAEDEVLVESFHLIQKEMADMRGRISREMAQREIAGRRALLEKRNQITREVFAAAAEILKKEAQGSGYASLLDRFAAQARAAFEKRCASAGLPFPEDVVLLLKEGDESHQGHVRAAFGRPCRFETDGSISIGGLRAYSVSLHLELDSALDSLLEDQRDWFEETSRLSVG